MNPNTSAHNHIAIIGTGFGGLAVALRLQRSGFNDFVLLERAADIGGVWRDNTYPGAAVDVQCQLYSLSSALNPQWHNLFAKQPEIWDYLHDVVRRFELLPHLMLNCAVERLDWDPVEQLWRMQTARGKRTATHVVVATGALAEPNIPTIAGMDGFAGAMFHSARWDHNIDLAGKRVAVIGTGASAAQFIPALQPTVTQLTVFQRTPAWVLPRHDRAISARAQRLLGALPVLQRIQRLHIYLKREQLLLGFRHPAFQKPAEFMARKHLKSQVKDSDLRAKLLPDYRLGCKRVLISDDYPAALAKENVTLVTDRIREVTSDGIIDDAGTQHRVDAIILGTGFKTGRLPLTDRIYGVDETSMAASWAGNPTAYLGTTVAGFPNCYLINGPNIGLGHSSMIYMYESQANYIASALSYARAHSVTALEPTAEAQDAFTAKVDRLSIGTVWTSGGCRSWYLNINGRNTNLWPGNTFSYRRMTRRFNPDHYVVDRRLDLSRCRRDQGGIATDYANAGKERRRTC
ncbi:4-hydroxyacetophenone monooxygenase [Mycobacterium sp. 1245111.1]|uniref:flavin-containing monooxygenase n=1 Tax=Mycobacterium sp. 1245111.1 TaxID=1834073 RepID=UPI00080200B8|nr:NAD(P)/FAD-dependent oxidoreductase [Mycobacterium sp. 1245111.1]OBK39173.1 4-hydroxyacetophenone monooxygenase [Mycobacterium sp. 1245111.1]